MEQHYSYGREVDGCDNLGNKIEIGKIVAFNLSGEIAKGEVHLISQGKRYGKPHTRYSVKLLHDAVGKRRGDLSTINNSRNMLVLDRPQVIEVDRGRDCPACTGGNGPFCTAHDWHNS